MSRPHAALHARAIMLTSALRHCSNCRFQKKPNEGRMKGLAFVLDPDGYWIEIVKRTPALYREPCNLSQTMLRVKDGTTL